MANNDFEVVQILVGSNCWRREARKIKEEYGIHDCIVIPLDEKYVGVIGTGSGNGLFWWMARGNLTEHEEQVCIDALVPILAKIARERATQAERKEEGQKRCV